MFSAAPLLSPLLNSPDANLPARAREELIALGREPNAEMVFEGMIALGRNLSREGRPDLAAALFSSVTHALENEFTGRPENHAVVRARAQRELDAVEGRGGLGMRAEFLSRHLAREATHPVGIAGMAFAGIAFSSVRVGMLSRLLGSPAGGFFTRGLGARALASTVAFGVEVPTFVFSGRVLNEAMGVRQDWTLAAMGRDLAANALVLGALKLSGGGATSAYQRMAGANSRPVLQGLFNQAGMFTGIVAGHRAEEFFGLRAHLDNATTLTDSLAMLLQFNVAGRLMQGAMGPRFSGFQRELHLRSQALDHRSTPSEGSPRSPSWAAVLESLMQPSALPVTPEGSSSGRDGRFSNLILMAASKGEGSGRRTRRGLGPSSDRSASPTPRPSEKDLPSPPDPEDLKPTQRFESSNPPAAESRDVENAATEMAALPPPAVVNPAAISSTEAVRLGAARTEVRVELPPRSDREGILPPPEAVVSPMGATEGTLSPEQLVGVNLPPARIRTSLKGNYASGARLGPDGRYEVIELIGKGGFGEVYKVHDTALDRYSAIKILQDPTRADLLELFLAERRMTARLDPRHAVVVYDTFRTESGQPTQVMEFLDGYNFNQLLRAYFRNEPLESENGKGFDLNEVMSLPNRFQMVADMLEALHSAHERGVIHRDVKPENIQWRRNGQIQFLDFGIGKESTEISEEMRMSLPPPEAKGRAGRRSRKPTTVSGTKGYIAPERWGNVENPRSVDVYAMAVVAYEMMSGAHPWAEFKPNPNYSDRTRATEPELILNREANSGRTLLAQFAGIMPEGVRKEPPLFRQIMTGELPPWVNEVEAVIRNGLRFNHKERPSTLREMREAWLLAPARRKFQDLESLRVTRDELREKLNNSWQLGREITLEQRDYYNELMRNIIRRTDEWERGSDDLIEEISALMGTNHDPTHWTEARKMIAKISYERRMEGGDRMDPSDSRAYEEKVIRNDPLQRREDGIIDSPLHLGAAIRGKSKVFFSLIDFETGRPVPAEETVIRVFPEIRMPDDNYRLPSEPLYVGKLSNFQNQIQLGANDYTIEFSHPAYRDLPVPHRISTEDVRIALESNGMLSIGIEMFPETMVPADMVPVHKGMAWVGHDYRFDGDVFRAKSIPLRQIFLESFFISRDPISVGGYDGNPRWHYSAFIRDLLAKGTDVNLVRSFLPRTMQPVQARGAASRIKAAYQRLRQEEGTLYWHLESKGMPRGKNRHFELIEPTTHLDPFGDPIFPDQPISAIRYRAAEAFASWRSEKEGRLFMIQSALQKEKVDRSSFPRIRTEGYAPFNPRYYISRLSFLDRSSASPQRIGSHPLGESRDFSRYGTRDNVGNVREFTSSQEEEGTIYLSGGSVREPDGTFFDPASKHQMHVDAFQDSIGAFRLVHVPVPPPR